MPVAFSDVTPDNFRWADSQADALYFGDTLIWAAETDPAFVVSTNITSHTSTTAIRVDAGDTYVPQANDLIMYWCVASVSVSTVTLGAGWTNILGSPTAVLTGPGDSHSLTGGWHVITESEELAGTNDWLFSGYYGGGRNSRLMTVVIRGANASDPIDAVSSIAGFDSNNVVPGLSGANLSSGSLVLSGVVSDGSGTYGAAPVGWTKIAEESGGLSHCVLSLDAPTIASVDVPGATITTVLDQFCAITVAINAGVGAAPTGTQALEGVNNAAGEWWINPVAVYQEDYTYPRTLIGSIDSSGNVLALERNHQTGLITRVNVASVATDDHSVSAIWAKNGRRTLLAYTNHNRDKWIRLRVGDPDGSITSLGTKSSQTFTTAGDQISYTQMIHIPALSDAAQDSFWMFSRRSNIGWVIIPFSVAHSTGTVTWGTERTVFRSPDHQLYAAIADAHNTVGNQVVRVACGHNPADATGGPIDHAVWYFEIDCITGTITCPDHPALSANATSGAGLPVDMINVTPRIPHVASPNNSRRLFYIRPGPDEPAIALAEWETDDHVATYRLHEFDGSTWVDRYYGLSGDRFGYTVAANYVAGMAFENPSANRCVFVAASDGVTETLTRYDRDGSNDDVPTVLVSQPTGEGRIARPYGPLVDAGTLPYDCIYNNITAYAGYTSYSMSSEIA